MLSANTRAGAKVIRVDMEAPVLFVDDCDKAVEMHLLALQNDMAELEKLLNSNEIADLDGKVWDAVKKTFAKVPGKIVKGVEAAKKALTKKSSIELYTERMDAYIKILMNYLAVLTQLLAPTPPPQKAITPDAQPDSSTEEDNAVPDGPAGTESRMGPKVFYVLRDD